MADKGWIKLHRQLQECPIWYGERFSKGQAWVDLLLSANHSDKKILFNGEMMTIKRGQYLTSTVKLAEKWGWNRKTVSSYLKVLESDKMIVRESDNTRTLVTIENYEIYQGYDETDGQPIGQVIGQPIGQQSNNPLDNLLDTNKNVKNVKNNICSFSTSDNDEIGTVDEQIAKEKKKSEKEELEKNFSIIYDSYPKKKGKSKAFEYYKGWVTTGRVVNGTKTKLTNRQIWLAVAKYKNELEQENTELQYYKNFDTFMNKAILDYVEEE